MLAEQARQAPSFLKRRLVRRLVSTTRARTLSENASLTWRIIAGATRPGEAHSLLRAWPGWEQLARFLWPVCEIPAAPYGLICFRITTYRGQPVALPDTAVIAPGATLGELHCNNSAVLKLVEGGGNPFAACREDLKSLSNWIVQDRRGREIAALYGSTILATAARRLGFTVRPTRVTLYRRLQKVFFEGLLLLYNRDGLARLQRGSTVNSYPAEVWLSRGELLQLYNPHESAHRLCPLPRKSDCASRERQSEASAGG